jgi:hypothetical protein
VENQNPDDDFDEFCRQHGYMDENKGDNNTGTKQPEEGGNGEAGSEVEDLYEENRTGDDEAEADVGDTERPLDEEVRAQAPPSAGPSGEGMRSRPQTTAEALSSSSNPCASDDEEQGDDSDSDVECFFEGSAFDAARAAWENARNQTKPRRRQTQTQTQTQTPFIPLRQRQTQAPGDGRSAGVAQCNNGWGDGTHTGEPVRDGIPSTFCFRRGAESGAAQPGPSSHTNDGFSRTYVEVSQAHVGVSRANEGAPGTAKAKLEELLKQHHFSMAGKSQVSG